MLTRLHREIYSNIDKSARILVAIHQNPDGDAIGSGLSLINYFQRKNWPATIFSLNGPTGQYDFLPNIEKITNDPKVFSEQFETIIVLDSGDLVYAGIADYIDRKSSQRPLIINIDHHHTNRLYGDLNLVDASASSTAEILFHFFDDLRIFIDKEMATCLLTGILMDTGAFSNPATTTSSLYGASKLLIEGADLKQIVAKAMKNKELKTLKLWGKAFSRLKKNKETGFTTTIITQQDMKECQTDEDAAEGVANFLNNLSDTKAVMVLMELADNRVKGSLRTTDDLMDVAKIATMFGGGGHKKAAGFTIKGSIKETTNGWQVV